MSSIRNGIGIFIVLIVVAVATYAIQTRADEPAGAVRPVRWLMAHAPTDLYTEATAKFGKILTEGSAGSLAADIVMPESLGLAADGDVPYATSMQLLREGSVEMSSVYEVAAGSDANVLWTLNLPFLFSGYQRLSPVLDGATGEQLLAAYSAATDAHALAFTLSGGFRIIASRVPVDDLADLKGLRVGTSGGPVAEATLRALGAIPVAMDLESGTVAPDPEKIDAIETTYTRLSSVLASDSPYLAHVVDTEHSLFLTMVIASDSFYNSLSEDERATLERAASVAAALERASSQELADATKAQLKADGRLVELSPDDRADIRGLTEDVYDAFPELAATGIVPAIRALQD
jgi:TRAP-type C4-dicarboxylate transport system substrate-binding protein